ncbi:MAG TPA: hypothetical protein VF503_29365 [Sphingobium sp.]
MMAQYANPMIAALGSAAMVLMTVGFLSFSGVALIWAAFAPAERSIIIF